MSEPITMKNYLKRPFIDEVKGALLCQGSGSGDVSDEDIATDAEVNDVLDDVFTS